MSAHAIYTAWRRYWYRRIELWGLGALSAANLAGYRRRDYGE
jgi:hypothetical protein